MICFFFFFFKDWNADAVCSFYQCSAETQNPSLSRGCVLLSCKDDRITATILTCLFVSVCAKLNSEFVFHHLKFWNSELIKLNCISNSEFVGIFKLNWDWSQYRENIKIQVNFSNLDLNVTYRPRFHFALTSGYLYILSRYWDQGVKCYRTHCYQISVTVIQV